MFPGRPGQAAVVQVPSGQPVFAPDQLRFVQPQLLVPSQLVKLQKSEAAVTQPPLQSQKSIPKMALVHAPLPVSSNPNMTVPISVNSSQVNAVKAREANANKEMHKGQTSIDAFKLPPAPRRIASTAPTTMSSPLQRQGVIFCFFCSLFFFILIFFCRNSSCMIKYIFFFLAGDADACPAHGGVLR